MVSKNQIVSTTMAECCSHETGTTSKFEPAETRPSIAGHLCRVPAMDCSPEEADISRAFGTMPRGAIAEVPAGCPELATSCAFAQMPTTVAAIRRAGDDIEPVLAGEENASRRSRPPSAPPARTPDGSDERRHHGLMVGNGLRLLRAASGRSETLKDQLEVQHAH
jgi:hypothetical protein